jgi:surface antigen/pimeloyl-ACP methyl ester carboxylesterase
LTLGPTGTLRNVSAAIANSLKLGRVAEAVAIDIPAYLVPPIGAVERTIDVSRFPLNGAADVARAFGGLGTVKWTGGSLSLPDATVLKNLTIVVENGDVNFNGDRHLLENVRLIVLNGSVNLGDVRAVNTSVYSAGGIRMNQGARFAGQNFLGTQNGEVIFNGATETIGGNDYVKVVAHGDVIFNAAANTRGDFWSTEDFFANRASTVLGSIRAKQSVTFNAQVRVISDVLRNVDFPVKNQPAIGIIDTGFARNNPDIDYSRIKNLKDWVGNDNDSFLNPGEGNEHGTHELGIIGAIQNNGIGIDGVNGNAPIYISRATGSGKWSRALVDFLKRFEADGSQPNPIVYLGFDLTQMNVDGTISTRTSLTLEERSALEYARQKGALIIVPAGNDGGVMSALGQAAQEFDNLVVVGAVDANGRASYSSYGAGLTIMAPGGTIADPTLSTVGDGLGTMAGTSIAAAYAVGHISNVWAANPNLSYQQVIDIIKATALDINQPGWDAETSAGVLDVVAAVELAQQTQGEIYDPPATVLTGAEAFSGGLALERPANWSTDFTGRIMSTIGAKVRKTPFALPDDSNVIGTRGRDELVRFTRWTYGDRVTDIALKTPDERWYYDARYGGWIASAIVDGNAPGSTPLPPNSGIPSPIDPKPIVPVIVSSPSYQNGRDNPFAYEWKGQCTWYAYGRMVETGLLPRGAAANGLFLGNAEAWRRDAARAGLARNSSPTPGTRQLVVFPPGVQSANSRYGHVAFVEEVLANGNIRISEYNWSSPETYGTRTLTPAQYAGLVFIPLENATTSPGLNSPPAKPGEQQEYRVRPGDTLSGIAYRKLGNADRWREIKKADGSTFTDNEARRLQVGQSVYFSVTHQTPLPTTKPDPKPDPKPQPQPIAFDPDAILSRATSLGTFGSYLFKADQIGYSENYGRDYNDYYKFYVDKPSRINLALDGLSGDADLQLLDRNGLSLATSNRSGTTTEAITYKIENSGDYYIRVSPFISSKTAYNLRIVNLSGAITNGEKNYITGGQLWRYDSNGVIQQGVENHGIESEKNTIIVTHGRKDSPEGSNIRNLLTTVAKKYGDTYQVLALDWQELARDESHPPNKAAAAIRPVANWAVNTLKNLGITNERISLFGHSLGSYVSSEIGRIFGKVENLVAIDPAFPGTSYDIDGTTGGNQTITEFKSTANHSLAFVVKEDGPGSIAGDGHTANKADKSLVISYDGWADPRDLTSPHNTAVDVVADAVSKGYLKLEDNLTLPSNLKTDKYGDSGNYVRFSGTHEGRVTATRDGKIKELEYVSKIGFFDTTSTTWT